jgi:TonB family protein
MEDRKAHANAKFVAEAGLGRCLVDGDSAARISNIRRRQGALGISLVIEFLCLALLIVAPLISTVAQPHLGRIFQPMPIIAGQRPRQSPQREPVSHPDQHRTMFPETAFPFPGHIEDIPKGAESGSELTPDFPLDSNPPGTIEIENSGPARLTVEPPSIETRKPPEKKVEKVSEGVQQAQLVSRIEPRYPFLAVQTRTQGTVVLHAIISREGRIEALEIVSSHPLLVQAAVDAVRQWRYRPTFLNGEPVEVETSITVTFRLSN